MDDGSSTTDEAFKIWTRVIEAESGRPYWKVVNEHAAFRAGAREGIRQSRRAVVESIERSADYGPNYYPDDALSAIDALEGREHG